jgi:hypothetical protein
MSKGIEDFSLERIIPADPCVTMAAAPTWIQLLLLSLDTYIAINSFGVIFRVFETKEVLISCWLIALGFQRSGVEGGSASNTNGLRSLRGEDD